MEENRKDLGMNKDRQGVEELLTQQLNCMKRQLWYSRLLAIMFLVLVLLVGWTAATIIPELNSVMQNMNEISQELNEENLGETIKNIDELTEASQDGMQQALDKLNEVDLESLNGAIEDLNAIIGPLARFFGRK